MSSVRGAAVVRRQRSEPSVVIQAGVRTFRKAGESYTPASITLRAEVKNVNNPAYEWGHLSGGLFSPVREWTGAEITVLPARAGVVMVRVTGSNIVGHVSDYVDISIVEDGEDGKPGEDGQPGESLTGRMLYADPTFKTGMNGISRYNNGPSTGTVAVARVEKGEDAPTQSTHELEITSYGSPAPGHGGFYWGTKSRANAVFVTKIIAKIPEGLNLAFTTNSTGTGSVQTWLTSKAGTGKYETYLFKLRCGAEGTFSTTNYFYLTGEGEYTEESPLKWRVAYATVFDQTDDGYGQIEGNAKDAFAQKLGYDSWEEMKGSLGEGMILETGLINAKVIDVKALATDAAFIGSLTGEEAFIDKVRGYEFDFKKGKVGGFTIAANELYAGDSGGGVYMRSLEEDYGFRAYKDANNYVEMFYRTASDWGLKGLAGGSPVFQLGSVNKIGPFVFGEDNLTAESVYDSRDLVLELTNNIISFKHGMGTIYQKEVYFGAVPDDISYGAHTLLAVVGGDIYHQGTVGEDGRRSARFYTSGMYFRGVNDFRQQISSAWCPVVLPLACGSTYVGDVDQTKYLTVQIGKNVGTTNYIVIGSFQARSMDTMTADNNLMFCTVLKGTTSFSINITEASGSGQTATFVWALFPL